MSAISLSRSILTRPLHAKSTWQQIHKKTKRISREPVAVPTTFRPHLPPQKPSKSRRRPHSLVRTEFSEFFISWRSRLCIGRAYHDRLRTRKHEHPKKLVFIQACKEWYSKWSASRSGPKSIFLIYWCKYNTHVPPYTFKNHAFVNPEATE